MLNRQWKEPPKKKKRKSGSSWDFGHRYIVLLVYLYSASLNLPKELSACVKITCKKSQWLLVVLSGRKVKFRVKEGVLPVMKEYSQYHSEGFHQTINFREL